MSEFEAILNEEIKNNLEVASELLIHRMATDVELFAILFFPHYCNMEFNQFHLDLFKSFQFGERKVRRARAAPRGSAKSTIATLIKPIHDLCYGLENFILFVSSTKPLANKKLSDIRAEVTSNTDLHDWFGVHFKSKVVGASAFTAYTNNHECHFAASGKGMQVRGIRYKQWRPSKLVFDDFEKSDEAASDYLRKKTKDVFHEEFGKTGNQFTNIEFVGTVLHKDALLPELLNNPAYDSKLYKAVISWSERQDLWNEWRAIFHNLDNQNRLADAFDYYKVREEEMIRGTQVLWPEKESYYDHMLDLEEIGKRAFYKEKQNSPIGSDEQIFEKIHWYKQEGDLLRILDTGKTITMNYIKDTCAGAVDPSNGDTKAKNGKLGDYSSMLVGYQDTQGRVLVHADFTKRVGPTKLINTIFDYHESYNFQKFTVETNLFRDLMRENLIAEKKRRESKSGKQIQLPFYEVNQTTKKAERILRLEPKVNLGYILFNVNLSKNFKDQLEDYPFHENDDAPDCLEILWNTFKGLYKPMPISLDNMAV